LSNKLTQINKAFLKGIFLAGESADTFVD